MAAPAVLSMYGIWWTLYAQRGDMRDSEVLAADGHGSNKGRDVVSDNVR